MTGCRNSRIQSYAIDPSEKVRDDPEGRQEVLQALGRGQEAAGEEHAPDWRDGY